MMNLKLFIGLMVGVLAGMLSVISLLAFAEVWFR